MTETRARSRVGHYGNRRVFLAAAGRGRCPGSSENPRAQEESFRIRLGFPVCQRSVLLGVWREAHVFFTCISVCVRRATQQSQLAYDCLDDYSNWLEGPAEGCESTYNGGADGSCMVSNKKNSQAGQDLFWRCANSSLLNAACCS